MEWELFFQLVVLIVWVAMLVNVVANNIVKNYWKESSEYFEETQKAEEEARVKAAEREGYRPKPYTTGKAV